MTTRFYFRQSLCLAVLFLQVCALCGLAAPRAPQPPLPELVRTSYAERFDAAYTKDSVAVEINVAGVGRLVESWSGYALERRGVVEPFVITGIQNGHTNLCPNGAVRFWVKPDWSSASTGEGKGPGQVVTLLELSVVGKGQTAPVWSLQVSATGSVLSLVGTGAKESGVLLQAEIAWTAGEWHQVILNYTDKGTALVVDGEFVAEGAGVVAVPPSVAALAVGSSLTGTESFEGELEDVFCFISPLKAAFEYGAFKAMAARGPITSEELAYRAELAAKWKAAKVLKAQEEESGGGMMLRLSGPSVDCVTNGPVYLTNVVCNFNTNDGWTVYFDIQGGTNEVDYDIFSTLELVGNDITNAVWTWLETGRTCETHYYTNQATNQTFYVLTIPGADRDADGLYDGWEWKHFGTLAQTADGDYDGDGVSNGDAYTNSVDPNQLKFAVDFGTRFVNANSASGSILVAQGVAEEMAVLVNSTNFASAVWQPFQTNVTASLGTTDGEYVVWVGLGGHAWDTERIWRGITITRDTVPPQVFVTSPPTNLTEQPVVQLQGYANEPLLAVRYDLTNAVGLETNLPGYVTQQYLDTNTLKFTTNWWQCYDVLLETNLNTLTVRVTDLAGNETTTNFNLTLDYSGDTNAPAITVTWPEDNALVAGSDFTLRGQLDDGTASVVVNLGPNNIAGRVARDGSFEIPAVPLLAATNTLTLIATDAAGNSQTNTRVVRQSSETLTINPVSPSDLTQPTVTVSGTVGVSGQNVWVNGVAANVSGNDWLVNLTTPSDNVANFDVVTGPAQANPTASQNTSTESPPQVHPVGYSEKFDYELHVSNSGFLYFSRRQNWQAGVGGGSQQTSDAFLFGSCAAEIIWPTTWPDQQSFTGDCSCLLPPSSGYGETTIIPWQQADLNYAETRLTTDDSLIHPVRRIDAAQRKAVTRLELQLGGASAGPTKLIRLIATAHGYADPGRNFTQVFARDEVNNFEIPGDVLVPVSAIRLFGQTLTPTATNAYVGELFVSLPAGTTNDLPVSVSGVNEYSFTVQAEEVKAELTVDANRDGEITFGTLDKTTTSTPYRFWVNDDQDDLSLDETVPAISRDADDPYIQSHRDLEDFSRMRIRVSGINQTLRNGEILLGLEWKEVIGNPQLRFFRPYETNGGTLYLTDANIAQQQFASPNGIQLIEYSHANEFTKHYPYIFPTSFWTNLTDEAPVTHLLFEAVNAGKGKVVLGLYKTDGFSITKVGESPLALYLDIKNIKTMYQRFDGSGSNQWPSVTFDPDPRETNQAIVFVHGWNMSPEGASNFAETMFKRLWHRGYKGRFAAFRWNTYWSSSYQWLPYNLGTPLDAYLARYNDSEYNGWLAGAALKNFVDGLPAHYAKNIAAHSMGNIVAGSALLSGMTIDNYALLQAAVPAACYDDGSSVLQGQTYFQGPFLMWDEPSPDGDTDSLTRSLSYRGRLKNVQGNLVSFFLPNDYATFIPWELNNDQTKPPLSDATLAYDYEYKPNNASGQKLYRRHSDYSTEIPVEVFDYYVTNSFEAMAYACRTWGKAVGAYGATQGAIDSSVDLSSSTYDLPGEDNGFGNEHSGEFNFNIQHLKPFYDQLIDALRVDRNP